MGASTKKDARELVKLWEKQGPRHTAIVNGAGHWNFYIDKKKITSLGQTPGDVRAIMNARQQLESAGMLSAEELKRRDRERRKRAKRRRDGENERHDQGQDQEQEGDEVAKIGDVARVRTSDGREVSSTELMPVNEILKNIQLAAELLWEAVMDRIRAEGPVKLRLGDTAGYRWQGSRDGVMKTIWPDMPTAREIDNGERPLTQAKIGLAKYLRNSQNMVVLAQGNQRRPTVWWVRASFNKAAAGVMHDDPQNWWEHKVTAEEAGETRPSEPVTVTFREPVPPPNAGHGQSSLRTTPPVHVCPECAPLTIISFDSTDDLSDHRLNEHHVCPECGSRRDNLRLVNLHRAHQHGYRSPNYTTAKMQRLAAAGLEVIDPDKHGFYRCPECNLTTRSVKRFNTHRRAYKNVDHPTDLYPCHLCPEIVETPATIAAHFKDVHRLDVSVCHSCGVPFNDRGDLRRHQIDEHQGENLSPVMPDADTDIDIDVDGDDDYEKMSVEDLINETMAEISGAAATSAEPTKLPGGLTTDDILEAVAIAKEVANRNKELETDNRNLKIDLERWKKYHREAADERDKLKQALNELRKAFTELRKLRGQ